MRHVTMKSLLPALAITVISLTTSAQQATQTPMKIPLRVGLTIVTAVYMDGDMESIKTITEANNTSVRLAYSAEIPDNEGPKPSTSRGTGKPGEAKVKRFSVNRIIARQDLENAVEYRCLYSEVHPESFPGSTAVGVSRRVLNDLKTKSQSPLKVCGGGIVAGLASFVNGLLGKDSPIAGMDMLSGTAKRVEPNAIPFKVLVNDAPVELPVIHARGKFDSDEGEFWILDDADNPLAMKWNIGDERLQVIRISFPAAAQDMTGSGGTPPSPGRGRMAGAPGAGGGGGTAGAGAGGSGGGGGSAAGAGGGGGGTGAGAGGAGTAAPDPAAAKRIETDLSKTGRTVVYGIYFDFASDRIKKESEPVLAEIAQVMKQNPTWKINVEGHTDNIGGDAYNMDLSQRRAAAVKQALVSRYAIGAARMQTAGFGLRVPKDRNDTIEGRARNRRVELVKRD